MKRIETMNWTVLVVVLGLETESASRERGRGRKGRWKVETIGQEFRGDIVNGVLYVISGQRAATPPRVVAAAVVMGAVRARHLQVAFADGLR